MGIKRGSQVILCTDGLANIGVGRIDNTDNGSDEYYENLGNWAMEKGVVVSIISITDNGCKLESLGRLVELTNGNLKRINPLKLTEQFSGILDKEIIATLTNSKMLLHPGLKFVDTVNELQNINPFENNKQNDKEKEKLKSMEVDPENVNINDKNDDKLKETDNKNNKNEDKSKDNIENKNDDIDETEKDEESQNKGNDDELNKNRKIY